MTNGSFCEFFSAVGVFEFLAERSLVDNWSSVLVRLLLLAGEGLDF